MMRNPGIYILYNKQNLKVGLHERQYEFMVLAKTQKEAAKLVIKKHPTFVGVSFKSYKVAVMGKDGQPNPWSSDLALHYKKLNKEKVLERKYV